MANGAHFGPSLSEHIQRQLLKNVGLDQPSRSFEEEKRTFNVNRGRRLRDGPPKLEVGDGPCIRPSPNILRSSVVGCALKHEQSLKGVITEFFSENSRFSCVERVIYDI